MYYAWTLDLLCTCALCILALVYTGRDTYQEGLACYRLGNAYEGIGEHDTAIQVCIHVLAHGYKHGSMDFLLCAVSQAVPGALQVSQ